MREYKKNNDVRSRKQFNSSHFLTSAGNCWKSKKKKKKVVIDKDFFLDY